MSQGHSNNFPRRILHIKSHNILNNSRKIEEIDENLCVKFEKNLWMRFYGTTNFLKFTSIYLAHTVVYLKIYLHTI